jgi:hypothetical protein
MAVTGMEIHARSIVLDGRPFAAAGSYEKIAGIVRFATDPEHEANEAITDIRLAPRDETRQVASWADFYLLREEVQLTESDRRAGP